MDNPTLLDRRRLLTAGLGAMAVLPALGPVAVLAQLPPRKAPQWDIAEWINADAGNVDTLRGKVIVIDFFQLWCPGCNQFSGPLMDRWQLRFADEIADGRLVLLKIHTVFEGHGYQSVERLKKYIEEKGITIPVGVDRHAGGRHTPETMRRYRTSGTPEMVVIDGEGLIRFQKFGGFDPAPIEKLIVGLMAAAPARA